MRQQHTRTTTHTYSEPEFFAMVAADLAAKAGIDLEAANVSHRCYVTRDQTGTSGVKYQIEVVITENMKGEGAPT